MLLSVSVENYRGFKAKTELDFRPLTILLGKNSSGKSSLIRLIPLLQQSLERQSSSPILWTSDSVDMGNVSDVLSHSQDGGELRIGIKVSSSRLNPFLSRRRFGNPFASAAVTPEMEYVVRLGADGVRTRFNGIEVRCESQTLAVDWDKAGIIKKFSVNGRSFPLAGATYSVDIKSLFPDISRELANQDVARAARLPLFYDAIRPALQAIVHGRTASEKIDYFARSFSYVPRAQIREAVQGLPNVVKKKLNDDVLAEISDLSMVNDLPRILEYLQFAISPSFLGAAYIGPSRASGKRFDRIQELSVNRLDSSGENTAMYVYSLNHQERSSFNELLVRACGHTMTVEESGVGHVSIKVARQGSNQFENIADVGFGFSQLVPVVAQLHAVRERNIGSDRFSNDNAIFAVEQPELHLHPAMQSNLADLFVGALKTDSKGSRTTTIVVETHSETMVAQLGLLVANGEIKSRDIAIYFVDKDEEQGTSSVREMKFDDDGVIDQWPVGFFSA